MRHRPPTHPTAPRHDHPARTRLRLATRNDDGSLLLVMLFTIIMTALTLVATATMLTGLAKTRNSRDYAVAMQAADAAFANVVMTGNMGGLSPTSSSPKSSPVTPLGPVTWQWTAIRSTSSPNLWNVVVDTKGERMTRRFTATLKSTKVVSGLRDTSTDTVRYIVDGGENYEYGFFGLDWFKVTTGAPDIDGYNGEVGTVGSAGNLTLGGTDLDRINLWSWTSDSGRCTGTACGTAETGRIRQKPGFTVKSVEEKCATAEPPWRSSSGTTLVAGRCYQKLTFDHVGDRTFDVPGVVYARNAGVVVDPGVRINTGSNYANAPAGRLRIATLGGFTLNKGAKVAMAIYAPVGMCQVTADANYYYDTIWMGAGTCQQMQISGNARLRYDGGLDLYQNSTPGAPNYFVWDLYDYQAIN